MKNYRQFFDKYFSMMSRTTITRETWRRTTIRRSQQKTDVFCEHCRTKTEMFALAEAAAISGVSQLAIFHRIERGELHFVETKAGALLICGNSLKNKINLKNEVKI